MQLNKLKYSIYMYLDTAITLSEVYNISITVCQNL